MKSFDLGNDMEVYEIDNDPEMNKIQDFMAKSTGARSVSLLGNSAKIHNFKIFVNLGSPHFHRRPICWRLRRTDEAKIFRKIGSTHFKC